VSAVLSVLFELIPLPTVLADVLLELFLSVGYLSVFLIPAILLKLLLRRNNCKDAPMESSFTVSRYLPCMVLVTVMLCSFFSQINSWLWEWIAPSSVVFDDFFAGEGAVAPYAAVLHFISMSVVPAFCEEILFRGGVLANLLPFGEKRAILISALLFSLMHQNPEQFLYTFAAGIALGMIYVYTRSIWSCMLAHFVNNFISVIEDLIFTRLGSTPAGVMTLIYIEGLIFLLGALSIFILTRAYLRFKKRGTESAFGKSLPTVEGYAVISTENASGRRGTFSGSILLYAVLCLFPSALLLLLSILEGGIL
jgi:membrane protease YdiL (CAAX protease family)